MQRLKKNFSFGLYPIAQRYCYALLAECAKQKIEIKVISTYRSVEEQDKLYAQGRTTPGNIVTNARGGDSYHNWHCAFDVFTMEWDKVGAIGKACGLEWGGNFHSIVDKAHFQVTLGYSTEDFKTGKVDLSRFQ